MSEKTFMINGYILALFLLNVVHTHFDPCFILHSSKMCKKQLRMLINSVILGVNVHDVTNLIPLLSAHKLHTGQQMLNVTTFLSCHVTHRPQAWV